MSANHEIRLAMLGMIPGNGHPYSWSAIINGYNPEAMAACPYPTIPKYLGQQPLESVRIEGVRVTHIWTDNADEAAAVAGASKIENVVRNPEDVIGEVDAVVIATDDGNDHVRRAAPFIKAGLPVLVDKPLAINLADLQQFIAWQSEGHPILSSSGMRYAPEIRQFGEQNAHLGDLRWITSFTCKTWERYGIHALEAIYPVVGPGFTTVHTLHQSGSDVVHLTHRTGVQVTIAAIHDALGSFGVVHAYGTKGQLALTLQDTYAAFRGQLLAFVEMLRSGTPPFPFGQTLELMAIIIAGIRSREEHRVVPLEEIYEQLNPRARHAPVALA
jgi:predicted dehydrogenase